MQLLVNMIVVTGQFAENIYGPSSGYWATQFVVTFMAALEMNIPSFLGGSGLRWGYGEGEG